jgi:voltage-dependent anion channel protein 2
MATSAPPAFKDIGKDVNDLLNRGFPSVDKFDWKFEAKTVAPNGVSFNPSLVKSTDVSGQLQGKISKPNLDLTGTLNLKNEAKAEAVFSVAKGLKVPFELSANLNNLSALKVRTGADFKNELVNASGSLSVPVDKRLPIINTSLTVAASPAWVVGAETELSETLKPNSLNGAIGYNQNNLSATAFYKLKKDLKKGDSRIFGVNYYQRLPAGWVDGAFGVEASYQLNHPTSNCSLSVGGSYKPDDSSTLKARLNNEGLLGLSYTQQMRGPFSLTFAADVNILDASAPDAFKYNVKVNLV